VTERLGPKHVNVLERIGPSITSRVGPSSTYQHQNQPQNRSTRQPRKDRPLTQEQLDAQMDAYMKGEEYVPPVDESESMEMDVDGSNSYSRGGRRGRGSGRGMGGEVSSKRDWDAPASEDPFFTMGNGASGGRVAISYGDDDVPLSL
jgi:hypothetical protein